MWKGRHFNLLPPPPQNHCQHATERKANLEEATKDSVWQIISDEIKGPWSLKGYSGMWNNLNTTYGIAVARDCVMQMLKEADPEASFMVPTLIKTLQTFESFLDFNGAPFVLPAFHSNREVRSSVLATVNAASEDVTPTLTVTFLTISCPQRTQNLPAFALLLNDDSYSTGNS